MNEILLGYECEDFADFREYADSRSGRPIVGGSVRVLFSNRKNRGTARARRERAATLIGELEARTVPLDT